MSLGTSRASAADVWAMRRRSNPPIAKETSCPPKTNTLPFSEPPAVPPSDRPRWPASLGLPAIVPSSALGRAGTVAPSNRVVLGCIGLGIQGMGNMRTFRGNPEVQVVAVCDVHETQRHAGQAVGRRVLRQQGLRGLQGLPRTDRPQGHRRRADHRARPLAPADRAGGGPAGQAHVLREADRLERPRGAGRAQGRQGERRRLPVRHPAAVRRQVPPGLRAGAQRQDRPVEDDPGRRARQLDLPQAAHRAGAQGAGLRPVARPGARWRRTATSAAGRGRREGRLQRLVLHLRLLHGHDRQLGRSPPRHRPVGQRHRAERARRRSKARASSPRTC